MADYTVVTPATLANFIAKLYTGGNYNPTDNEDLNKVGQVDVQTRRFIYDYLLTKFSDSTELLLPAALGDASLANKVKGSTGNAGTAQAIVQGTVSTPDLRDLAVSTAKIADQGVTSAKIADSNVTATQLGANAVTEVKIIDGAVTVNKLGNLAVTAPKLSSSASDDSIRAVTTDHIKDAAVTAAKLASGALTFAALPVASAAGHILVSNNTTFAFEDHLMSGGATIGPTGVVTLATINRCELVERANNGVAAGASAAATWEVRGVGVAWVEAWRSSVSAFATIGAAGKFTLPVGTYIVEASAPAYKVGRHICRLVRYNAADAVQETYYGSSEVCPAAGALSNRTLVTAKITVAVGTDYLKLEHYTELVEAVDGLGFPSSSGGTYEVYAKVRIDQIA